MEGDIVRARFVRVVADLADADAVAAALDAARGPGRKLLLDYRGVSGHAEEVRDAMWQWAKDGDLILAMVVDAELARVRINMLALSHRLRVRAFLDERDAMVWLAGPSTRTPTRETPQM